MTGIRCSAADRDIVLRACEVGAMLTEEKAKLKKAKGGKWSKWIEENFKRPGGEPLSQNTAIDYMQLAEYRDRLEAWFSQHRQAAVISSIRQAKEVIKALKREDEMQKKLVAEEQGNGDGIAESSEAKVEQENTGNDDVAGENDGYSWDYSEDTGNDDDDDSGPAEFRLETYERVFKHRDTEMLVSLARNFDWQPEYTVARRLTMMARNLEEARKMHALREARKAQKSAPIEAHTTMQ
jgi:hypothetical protein